MEQKVRLDGLSKNIITIMERLAKNTALAQLLVHNTDMPYTELPFTDTNKLIRPSDEYCHIFPYPFDIEATDTVGSFIRVYYNSGKFENGEVISNTQLHIDVVVAKEIWLINNGTSSQIRPYEIISRIMQQIGIRSVGSPIRLEVDGWQHLAVNTKYDAIRLYCSHFTVETR